MSPRTLIAVLLLQTLPSRICAQAPDTTDMKQVFRAAIVAAFDLMKQSPFVRDAPHIKIAYQSMQAAAGTDTDLSDVADALGPIGTRDDRADCGNHERCPIIKGDSIVRHNDGIDVYLVLDATRRANGRMYVSIATYVVKFTRRSGKLEVASVRPVSIT